jgi:tRNA (cmo5U34)-methyltransferase
MKSNDFDSVAFIYDHLAKLIFGGSIIESQKYFLNKIPERANILILGGGTGRILKELFKIRNDVTVCYIEASAKMIARAKEKSINDDRVQFILGTESDIPPESQYDLIITNFYLDLFSGESLQIVIRKIKKSLAPHARWIVTDFDDDRWWQKAMLKAMYFFFRLTCNIEGKKLPEWEKELQVIGAAQIDTRKFYRGFIVTSIFQF